MLFVLKGPTLTSGLLNNEAGGANSATIPTATHRPISVVNGQLTMLWFNQEQPTGRSRLIICF
jgi:hypothetical protein